MNRLRHTRFLSATLLLATVVLMLSAQSCRKKAQDIVPPVTNRDSLPFLNTIGVSTLISDSGIIRYKIITEEWALYDKTNPPHWYFPKGLFLEKFNEDFHVDAFVTADTAYYYNVQRLWELRGRVQVKNLKGETFKTSLLFWDENRHRIYSDRYMEINGIENQLSGYDFSSDESMTDYIIHSSTGAFPLSEEKSNPVPVPPDGEDTVPESVEVPSDEGETPS